MVRQLMRKRVGIVIAVLMAAAFSADAQAQTGTVTGTVTDQQTGAPLPTVQVYLLGTSRGTLSGPTGTFSFVDVPAGTYTVVGQRIGYQEARQTNVVIGGGQTATISLAMAPSVLTIEGIVATGLVDPVQGVRSPISVGRISRENMPVTVAGSAIQNLQGQVAGVSMSRQSGQPGSDVSIMLRTPTMVDNPTPGARGARDTNPLIVVDGVILGTSTTNLESLDIESMEIIRGAAASSLYGSRAAAGVISITTNRGRGLDMGTTQFQLRSETGFSQALSDRSQPQHHIFRMNEAGTAYVNAAGRDTTRAGRIPITTNLNLQFMDQPFPNGKVYDNLNAIFRPGNFQSHNFQISQNTESTNFAISLSRYLETGLLENNEGYNRNSFRVNLDHRFLNSMSLGVAAFHSRDFRDELVAANLFQTIALVPPDVDLTVKDDKGNYVRIPDPEIGTENPLWVQGSRESERSRARTLANANLRWDPLEWASVSLNASYDREDARERYYVPKDTPSSGARPDSIRFQTALTDTWNAEAQLQVRRDFGDLNSRMTFRGLFERQFAEELDSRGRHFLIGGVPRIDATPTSQRYNASYQQEVRSDGFLWDTALDYAGKYIATFLLRWDGSSLFGVDNRWHNYYRTAFAYRLGEEEWFNLPGVDEFKLSYARGTAGGRPPFQAQYEVWQLVDGQPTKSQLGNRDLRPEHTTEQEVSLDMIVGGRYGVTLTHAWQRTEEQLVTSELPNFFGYPTQWKNGGTVSGHTTELTLEARLVQTPRFAWTSTIVGDYSEAKIEDWPFAPENPAWRQYSTGVGLYEIWGAIHVHTPEMLLAHHNGALASRASEFQINDDGMYVWVGEGNTWRDGIAKNLWGTQTTIAGTNYVWGIPFVLQTQPGAADRVKIGDATHANIGWMNNFNFGQLSFHSQVHAKIGGDLVNSQHQSMTTANIAPDMDQAGRPDWQKKPMNYYQAVYAGGGGNYYYLEDGSYIKLRTLSANYRFAPNQISRFGLSRMGIRSFQVGLIGRNLLTISDFKGLDPEMGLNFAGGSQTAARAYPPSRTLTAEFSLTF